MIRPPQRSTLFPSTTLSRSGVRVAVETLRTSTRTRPPMVCAGVRRRPLTPAPKWHSKRHPAENGPRSEEHTSELQSRQYLVCRLLLEKKINHHLSTIPLPFC